MKENLPEGRCVESELDYQIHVGVTPVTQAERRERGMHQPQHEKIKTKKIRDMHVMLPLFFFALCADDASITARIILK
jgi:hypothetical protein